MLSASLTTKQEPRLPNHIAIIMDGNGRWAEQRGLPRLKGHEAGVDNIRIVVKHLNEYQIKYVTLYGFSTENWNRPEDEVKGLLKLLEDRIDNEAKLLNGKGVKIRHLGSLGGLPGGLQESINRALELTRNNSGMVLSIAFNYGGRTEILDAVRHIVAEGIPPNKIDEKLFSNRLYTVGLPDVDLVVRTSGELRISNFLIWQTAYSEYYSTKVLWPDFDKQEIERALIAFGQRQRRFGGR